MTQIPSSQLTGAFHLPSMAIFLKPRQKVFLCFAISCMSVTSLRAALKTDDQNASLEWEEPTPLLNESTITPVMCGGPIDEALAKEIEEALLKPIVPALNNSPHSLSGTQQGDVVSSSPAVAASSLPQQSSLNGNHQTPSFREIASEEKEVTQKGFQQTIDHLYLKIKAEENNYRAAAAKFKDAHEKTELLYDNIIHQSLIIQSLFDELGKFLRSAFYLAPKHNQTLWQNKIEEFQQNQIAWNANSHWWSAQKTEFQALLIKHEEHLTTTPEEAFSFWEQNEQQEQFVVSQWQKFQETQKQASPKLPEKWKKHNTQRLHSSIYQIKKYKVDILWSKAKQAAALAEITKKQDDFETAIAKAEEARVAFEQISTLIPNLFSSKSAPLTHYWKSYCKDAQNERDFWAKKKKEWITEKETKAQQDAAWQRVEALWKAADEADIKAAEYEKALFTYQPKEDTSEQDPQLASLWATTNEHSTAAEKALERFLKLEKEHLPLSKESQSMFMQRIERAKTQEAICLIRSLWGTTTQMAFAIGLTQKKLDQANTLDEKSALLDKMITRANTLRHRLSSIMMVMEDLPQPSQFPATTTDAPNISGIPFGNTHIPTLSDVQEKQATWTTKEKEWLAQKLLLLPPVLTPATPAAIANTNSHVNGQNPPTANETSPQIQEKISQLEKQVKEADAIAEAAKKASGATDIDVPTQILLLDEAIKTANIAEALYAQLEIAYGEEAKEIPEDFKELYEAEQGDQIPNALEKKLNWRSAALFSGMKKKELAVTEMAFQKGTAADHTEAAINAHQLATVEAETETEWRNFVHIHRQMLTEVPEQFKKRWQMKIQMGEVKVLTFEISADLSRAQEGAAHAMTFYTQAVSATSPEKPSLLTEAIAQAENTIQVLNDISSKIEGTSWKNTGHFPSYKRSAEQKIAFLNSRIAEWKAEKEALEH